MRLWIGNMAPGTTDDEIKAFLKKYAANLECSEIERVEGDGHASGRDDTVHRAARSASLGNLAFRLNGMYWKGRPLNCNTLMR